MLPDPQDLLLIDRLHGGFPLSERPYRDIAIELGWSEAAVIERLQLLLEQGVLTRFVLYFRLSGQAASSSWQHLPRHKTGLMRLRAWSMSLTKWRTTIAVSMP